MEIAKIIFYLIWFVIDSFLHPSEYERSKHPEWLKTIRQSAVLRVLAFLLTIGSIVSLATYAVITSNKLSSALTSLTQAEHSLALISKDNAHLKSLGDMNCKLAAAASAAAASIANSPVKSSCNYRPLKKAAPPSIAASAAMPMASDNQRSALSLTQVNALMLDDEMVPAK